MTIATMPGIALLGGFDDARAIDSRQTQVSDQDVERELIQILDSLFAGIRFHYVEPALREPFRHQPAQSRLVVNEQEMGCGLGTKHSANRLTQSRDLPTQPGKTDMGRCRCGGARGY